MNADSPTPDLAAAENRRRAISIDELAAKLDAAARRRGVDPQVLVDRFIAELDDDPLIAFIGVGASGQSEQFEIRNARRTAAEKKLARGV